MEKSKARTMMERAASYLASGDNGRTGLNPREVEVALFFIKDWKSKFVAFMKDQPNRDDKKGRPLGVHKASEIADAIFRGFYNAEVTALDESTISPYWSRDPGEMEFGHLPCESIPRNMCEIPEGYYYLPNEDEYSHLDNYTVLTDNGDDEYVEPGDTSAMHTVYDWDRRELEYAELLIRLAKGEKAEVVLGRAKSLCDIEVISSWQFYKLRESAAMIVQKDNITPDKPQSRIDWISEQLALEE